METGNFMQVWAALGAVKVEQDAEGLGTDGGVQFC